MTKLIIKFHVYIDNVRREEIENIAKAYEDAIYNADNNIIKKDRRTARGHIEELYFGEKPERIFKSTIV